MSITKMILAELTGRVAMGLQQFGDGGVFGTHTCRSTRQADLTQTGAKDALTHDECGTAGSATLLGVVIGKDHTLVGDAVDVGRVVAHHSFGVGADIGLANVVPPDDENVWLLLRLLCHKCLLSG